MRRGDSGADSVGRCPSFTDEALAGVLPEVCPGNGRQTALKDSVKEQRPEEREQGQATGISLLSFSARPRVSPYVGPPHSSVPILPAAFMVGRKTKRENLSGLLKDS